MVMPDKKPGLTSAAGAGTQGGRRPTVVAAPATADPELVERPRRRTFTDQDVAFAALPKRPTKRFSGSERRRETSS